MCYACITLYSFAIVGLLHERLMTGLDPGNFLAAIELGLDTLKARPHVPGYPLFVLLWQGLTRLGLSPEGAIFFSNGIWISIGLCALHKLAMNVANARVAMVATLFAGLNPLVLFYGATGELYVYDLAFSSVFMLLVTSAKREQLKWVWLAFGIAGGFRLSSVVFLYPAMFAATWLRKEKLSSIAAHHAFVALGMLVWLVPFIMHHGGIASLAPIWKATASLPSTVRQSSATYLSSFFWMLHLALPLLVLAPKALKKLRRDHLLILAVWLVMPTFFFLFRFYAKGYILLTLPVFAIMIGLVIDSFSKRTRQVTTTTVLAAGLACFFFVPHVPPSIALERSEATSDRIKTAGLRTLSWFAASNAHLRAREDLVRQAKYLLNAHVPLGGVVLADGSMSVYAHPRTLQFHVPDRNILVRQELRVARLYAYEVTNELDIADALADTSYYICPTELAQLTPAIQALSPVGQTESLSLYRGSAAEITNINANTR